MLELMRQSQCTANPLNPPCQGDFENFAKVRVIGKCLLIFRIHHNSTTRGGVHTPLNPPASGGRHLIQLRDRGAPNRLKADARPITVLWGNKSIIRTNHRHRAVAPVV